MTRNNRTMRIKAFIFFSGLVLFSNSYAAPVNQADLSAKCAAVTSSALTLSAATQSITHQDSNNILSAFYLFSMFSGRRLGEDEFLKRYNFHQEALAKQWKYDIVTKGAFRATLDFDGRLAGLMKPCSLISRNFESSKSPELKAIKKFVESDEGKHLIETLKEMLKPDSNQENSPKQSDENIETSAQSLIKTERKPNDHLKFILVQHSSYDAFAEACIDSYDNFDNAVLIGCNNRAYEQASYYLQILTDKLANNYSKYGGSPVRNLQRQWDVVVESECSMEGELIGSPMSSSCKLEQINLRIHQLNKASQESIIFPKIDELVINAINDEVSYLVLEVQEKIRSNGDSDNKFNALSKKWNDFIEYDCELQKKMVSIEVYDTCYLEHMSLRVRQLRRYVDKQVPIEGQQLLQQPQ